MGIRAAARHRVAQGPPRQARLRTVLVPRRGAATRAGGADGMVPARLVGVGETFHGRSARISLAIAIGERVAETFWARARFRGRGLRPSKCRNSHGAPVEAISFSQLNQPGSDLGSHRKS